MNTVPTITPGSITGIGGLTSRPVYFLKMNGANNASLVVKGESNIAHAPTSVTWGAKLMKNVNDDRVNTKVMTAAEIQEFKAVVTQSFDPAKDKQANWIADPFMWVKMPFVAGLSDAGLETTAMNWTATKKGGFIPGPGFKGNATDLKNIRQAIPKLCNSNYWKELGTVVAVDVFIGNGDRFNIDTGAWANSGNVMFAQNGNTFHAIGLDTLDPNSPKCDGSNFSRSNLTRPGVYTALTILTDPSRRKQFAEAATKSVGAKMAEQLKGVATLTAEVGELDGRVASRSVDVQKELPGLFVKFAPSFEYGLMMGATDLRTYLQRKVAQYKATQIVAAPVPGYMPPMPHAPAMRGGFAGQHRRAVAPPPAAPLRPANASPTKSLPAGILDRMRYLGW